MIRTKRTLIGDGWDEQDVEVEVNNLGQLTLECDASVDDTYLSASQVLALRDFLNEHFADDGDTPEDDALATLDRELSGHPMSEVNAVVAGVPVAVGTGINGGAK